MGSVRCVRREAARAEENVFAECERSAIEQRRFPRGVGPGVDADIAEICVQAAFHEGADGRVQGAAFPFRSASFPLHELKHRAVSNGLLQIKH
jgi:hypothetical protein